MEYDDDVEYDVKKLGDELKSVPDPKEAALLLSDLIEEDTVVLYDESSDRTRVYYTSGGAMASRLTVPSNEEPDLDDHVVDAEDSLSDFYKEQEAKWSKFLRLLKRMEGQGFAKFFVRHEDGALRQMDSAEDFYFYVDEDHQ